MEGPKISCASKLGSDHEESGWTAYLDDFQSSYSIDSPSLVSDAAWNGHNTNHHLVFGSSSELPLPKRLNFNNSNSKKFCCDHDLEDTASSPVNSPKVSSLKPRNVNYRRSDDTIDQFLGKQNGSANFSLQRTNDQRKEMNFGDGRNGGECMEQKKMGFCLVPVALLMNHLH